MDAIALTEDLPLVSDEEAEIELAKAWPRFWARLLDITILSFPVGMLIGLLFPSLMVMDLSPRVFEIVVGMIALPLVLVVDALLLSLLGTSPGKAIVGLKVVDMEMRKLSTEAALRRNVLLYLKGLAGGIPLLNLIGYGKGHADLAERGFTTWDEATDSRVIENGYHIARATVAAVVVIGLNAAARML